MPVFECRDCMDLHTVGLKRSGYTGYGTCACICPLCANESRTLCKTCKGTGKTGLFGRICNECNGKRTVLCAICKGFLAHPSCHVCRGTSCETCFGSRRVDLELILAKLKSVPRRPTLLRPVDPPRTASRVDFPVFTFERLWNRLEPVVDLETPLSVSRDSGWERVRLQGKLIDQERPDYWIYRVGENEFGIVEQVSHTDWADHLSSSV